MMRACFLFCAAFTASLHCSFVSSQFESPRIVASDSTGVTEFGGHVSIDGPWAAVGAIGSLTPLGSRGAVYLFLRERSDTWVQFKKLYPPAASPNYGYSKSLMLKGDTLL